MQQNISRHWGKVYGLILLLALLIVGLCIYRDYGATWDEQAQRMIGFTNLQYIRSGDDGILANFSDRDHGAAFELPLIWIESLRDNMPFGDVVHMRHLFSFLFYVLGLGCGYLLALRLFKKQWIAVLGVMMLVLQPRIFAHAFINSKDVPFMSAILIALYGIHVALDSRRGYQYVLAGLACGFATGIRNLGVLLAGLALLMMLLNAFQLRLERRKILLHTLLFLVSGAAMLYLCWPALWDHPLERLQESFSSLSNYTQWSGSVLLNGTTYPSGEEPWYYAPEWFIISTPLLWLLLGLTGIIAAVWLLLRRRKYLLTGAKSKTLLIAGLMFLIPFAAVISLGSVLYDDWRHLYFTYAGFVMIALYGAERIATVPRLRSILAIGFSVELVVTGAFMIRAHPFQMVYFNPLVPHSPEYLRENFDYEYWGTSNRQALDYILANDGRQAIPIVLTNHATLNNAAALPPESRARIRWMTADTAGAYIITAWRFHPEDYPYRKVWGISAGGSTVMQIYQIDTIKN